MTETAITQRPDCFPHYCEPGNPCPRHASPLEPARELAEAIQSFIGPKGYDLAAEDDPGFAGREDNEAIWYSPSGSLVILLRLTEEAAELHIHDLEGGHFREVIHPASVPLQAATAELLAQLIAVISR